jgi:hypothetical protein
VCVYMCVCVCVCVYLGGRAIIRPMHAAACERATIMVFENSGYGVGK